MTVIGDVPSSFLKSPDFRKTGYLKSTDDYLQGIDFSKVSDYSTKCYPGSSGLSDAENKKFQELLNGIKQTYGVTGLSQSGESQDSTSYNGTTVADANNTVSEAQANYDTAKTNLSLAKEKVTQAEQAKSSADSSKSSEAEAKYNEAVAKLKEAQAKFEEAEKKLADAKNNQTEVNQSINMASQVYKSGYSSLNIQS